LNLLHQGGQCGVTVTKLTLKGDLSGFQATAESLMTRTRSCVVCQRHPAGVQAWCLKVFDQGSIRCTSLLLPLCSTQFPKEDLHPDDYAVSQFIKGKHCLQTSILPFCWEVTLCCFTVLNFLRLSFLWNCSWTSFAVVNKQILARPALDGDLTHVTFHQIQACVQHIKD